MAGFGRPLRLPSRLLLLGKQGQMLFTLVVALLMVMRHILHDWRLALLFVKPETVIAWHREGFRLYWGWKSRCCEGRPTVSPEVRNLIRHMSLAGELLAFMGNS